MTERKCKFVKITINKWENASRDKRELSIIKEFDNTDIKVFAKGDTSGQIDQVSGYNVYRISTRPLGNKVPNILNKIVSLFTWAYIISKENANIISGHDMVALFIGYLSNLFKRKKNKAKLVYDSHEFELGRNVNRNKLQKRLIKVFEGFLIKRSDMSIMVNNIIADEVTKIYQLEKRPVVVRNIPNYWNLDEFEIEKTRKYMLSKFSRKDEFIVMFHGLITRNRGIEKVLDALEILNDFNFFILGNGEESYIEELKRKSCEKKIEDRVYFHNAVTIEELYKYISAADIGIIIPPDKYRSYYYMLPNKFFENIQALTPIIVSDFPAVGEIVDKYDIGIKVNPDNILDITNAIKNMQNDKELYCKYKRNLVKAKETLCWENEKKELYEGYKNLLSK